jgi:hypothetical protein
MKIVDAKSNLPFSEPALAKMLETYEELFIGYNFQDKDILKVGNEAYVDTAWYVSKEENSYFLSSWLDSNEGEGQEESTVKEFKTIEELYVAIQNLEPFTDMPALQEAASEEKQFRSEYKKLMSTPEGREQYKTLPLEQRIELMQADRAVDPVDQILQKTPDIPFEYEGFDSEWSKDHFDPNSWYGHYTTDGVDHYGDYSYKVDATTVFEDIRDDMIPKYLNKVPSSELVIECKKLYDAWNNSTDETEEETGEAFEVFIAKNLEELAEIFNKPLSAQYAENAQEWASEHLEPMDDWDYYNMPDRTDENLKTNTAKEFKEYETLWEN